MLWNYIFYHHIASGCCCCTHKGTSLDLIRNNRIFCAVKPLYAPDTDCVCSCTLNIGSHTVKEVCHIYDMGLLGSILKDRLSLCHSSSHHDIDGRSHRNHIQINMTCHQINGMGDHCSALNLYICSQRPEALNMLVNGAASDIAASGKRNLSALVFS